eukprot:973341-Rhodomonas_salina.2
MGGDGGTFPTSTFAPGGYFRPPGGTPAEELQLLPDGPHPDPDPSSFCNNGLCEDAVAAWCAARTS